MSLPTPAAPTLKGDRLPKELIDLLPEETAGVVVVDVRRLAECPLGKQMLASAAEEYRPDTLPYLPGKDILRDAERIVLAHSISDNDVNSVCIIIQLRAGATVGDAMVSRSLKSGVEPQTVGKHKVYSLDQHLVVVARPDPRTIMVVACIGSEEDAATAQRAAFAERKNPGPNPTLRRLLETDRPDGYPIYFAGAHPAKTRGAAANLLFWGAGLSTEKTNPLGVEAYLGGIKFGNTAVGRVRFAAKDADAAKTLLENCQAALKDGIEVPWKVAARVSYEFVLDGKELTMEMRVEPATTRK